jgi:hypothetical protein
MCTTHGQMAHASAQEVAKSAKLEAITLREKLTQEKVKLSYFP